MQILRYFFFILIFNFSSNAQITYYEDVFHGRVIALGSANADGLGSATQNTGLSASTPVRKFFFICYGQKGFHFTPTQRQFKLNNLEFSLDTLSKTELRVGNNTFITSPGEYNGHVAYCVDLTSYFPTIGSTLSIEWLFDIENPPFDCPSCRVGAPRIVILTDEPALPPVVCSIQLNDQDNSHELTVSTNQMTKADFNFPIALGIHSDRLGGIGGNGTDGYNFWINNAFAGKIVSGDNYLSGESITGIGAMGNFSYAVGNYQALTDDNVDAIFNGPTSTSGFADGLVTVNSFITNNYINPLEMRLAYVGGSQNQHNFFISYTLAYATPCEPQDVSVSNDTLVCPNEPMQLHASGGSSTPLSHPTYEWFPHKDLSCYDCADPVFQGDSSQLYSVRIWGSDSCSVVRPVMVNVRPIPTFSNISLNTSECGGATGSISVFSPTAEAYSIDNSNWVTSTGSATNFNNLGTGNYTIYVTDTSGCVGDSTVFLDEEVTVNAAFTVNPTSGAVPLNVNILNQSTHFTDMEWFLNSTSQGNSFSNFTASTAGTYTIELIAWQNNVSCADTVSVSVFAFDTILVHIPNVISPNNDGVNDEFTISTNLPVNIEYSISNRWGNVVAEGTFSNVSGTTILWSPSTGGISAPLNDPSVVEGTYFYMLRFSSENESIQQQLGKLGKEKEGFVTVVR